MHVFEETTVLEVVDEGGKPVEPGEDGELIATHLWQKSMPFIRYRMADRGAISVDPCDCGRPHLILDRVVGRSGQSFTRSDGTLVFPEVFAHVVMREHDIPDVRRFQVVQESPDHIVVRFIPEPGTEGISADVRERMSARISEIMRSPCRVDFVPEDSIDPAPGGKFLYAVSKVTSGVPDW
jgi:phenylacetate-CoA ligase